MDDLALSNIAQPCAEDCDPALCPMVDMPWEEYKSRWLPWRRALIFRVLGKGFIVSRFYCSEDYIKVLSRGP